MDDTKKSWSWWEDESRIYGKVLLIGDGRVLEEKTIRYGDEAQKISADLTGYNKLIIRFDGCGNYDIMNGRFLFKD